ncbi:unnamed protein product [Linum trigynum]|uniref:Uncharacterized protein n=2 Tax=Linum trigynum TaxID=586398 RepID=A0AAV2DVP1_9ROSI
MMATAVEKRVREETGEGPNGGSDNASKKHQGETDVGAGGEGGGNSAEKEEVVLWMNCFSGKWEPMTARYLVQDFHRLVTFMQDNTPIPDRQTRGLLDLVKKGHPEPEKMIGCGVESFQVREHSTCTSFRTFFLVRKDGSREDFCFRSCVNKILPLPKDLRGHGIGIDAVCLCHLGGWDAVRAAKEREGGAREILARRLEEKLATFFSFGTSKFMDSSHMFHYYYSLLLGSPLNQAITEKAHLMLLELLRKGDPESERKIGSGIESFQVRIHPAYGSELRSFYLVREDGSMEDFCYIKCVDNFLPLPEELRETIAGPCSCHHKEDGQDGVTLGMSRFRSSAEMVSYFEKLFVAWPLNTPLNSEVEYKIVLDLLKKGDPEWEEKMKPGSGSGGIPSFQIREWETLWDNRSFFIVWEDGSMEPFCVMTCIDNILPLPIEYQSLSANFDSGGRSGRGGGKRGAGKATRRGRGRGRH